MEQERRQLLEERECALASLEIMREAQSRIDDQMAVSRQGANVQSKRTVEQERHQLEKEKQYTLS